MMSSVKNVASPLVGVGFAAAGWAAFSLQDAIIKYLVVALPVPEILFTRSVAIVIVAALAMRPKDLRATVERRNLSAIGLRAVLILAAWWAYYTAARSLTLPALVTLYFAAPLFVVALSRATLGEIVGPDRWLATIVGFGGVLVAADLVQAPSVLPAALAVFAALCWAATSLLTRSLSRSISTASLMVGTNLVFVVACATTAPFVFVAPTLSQLALLMLLSVFGGLGQYFAFQGLRLAPASAVAPFEYTSLAWATLWGWVFFGDLPSRHVILGGAIILLSALILLIVEGRRYRAARA
jgi:S-adenosylmethionine uptake transporter